MEVRLKEIREISEKTQQEIANALNVKRGTYASWECGSDTISTQKVYDLANYYNKSIDFILGLSSNDMTVNCDKDLNVINVGNNLKYIRTASNETIRTIAKNININNSTWWGYENGKALITLPSLIEVSKKYNYSIDWILGRTNK